MENKDIASLSGDDEYTAGGDRRSSEAVVISNSLSLSLSLSLSPYTLFKEIRKLKNQKVSTAKINDLVFS